MANIDAYSAAESWIKLNLKEDPNQQLPKHSCYMAYVKCMLNQNILTIPNYDFGKIVKCLFRNVRSSGPRGSNSNYCSGITLSSSSIPGNPSSYQIPPPPTYKQCLVPIQQPSTSYEPVLVPIQQPSTSAPLLEEFLVPYRQPPYSSQQVLIPYRQPPPTNEKPQASINEENEEHPTRLQLFRSRMQSFATRVKNMFSSN